MGCGATHLLTLDERHLMGRPILYPNQLVCQIGDELNDRIEADAAARDDTSKSAAARRLLQLGVLLADALDGGRITELEVFNLETDAREVK